MTSREQFKRYIERRRDPWQTFDEEPDWRICSRGSPRAGEYANLALQELWDCWKAARSLTRKR